mmetsp:Transcript_4396/g.8137  ORF Transcript_4396/g.8137 Transcript_4396/m.8137 type:complete len:682 (+) Transcript_4396:62-2107(+)
MCGIFAYLNYGVSRDKRYILEALYKGLRRLEYRGYDSSGLAVDLGAENFTPVVYKAEGKIDALVEEVEQFANNGQLDLDEKYSTHTGIAHTRWATHGRPEKRNSHPQSSGVENDFVVVHNGIITNYKTLKQMLIRKGYEFESDTDTEVIPKLAKYLYDMKDKPVSFFELVTEVMKQLEGAYALLFKSTHYPNEIVACKRGSPLILGIKNDQQTARMSSTQPQQRSVEYFLASDPSALVEHTKSVLVLEDDDVAHLFDGEYNVYRVDRESEGNDARAVDRVTMTLQIEVSQIMKGEFSHFMQKEIHEQPESLMGTLRGRVQYPSSHDILALVGDANKGGLKDSTGAIKLGGLQPPINHIICKSRRILFIACGTSFNAALAARQTVEELVEVPVMLELASDMLDRQCPMFRDDTAVFVSQSGETADTLEALKYAKDHGAFCVGITNTVGSAISRATECGVHINAGCEIGVASTKAYTSQIVAITMWALALSEDKMSKAHRRQDIIRSLLLLPSAIQRTLALEPSIMELAKELANEQSLLLFGRGFQYATALEGALKVKEVSLMHSEGILAGEMKHGPLALVDEHLPLIVVATKDRIYKRQQNVIQQLRARRGRLIVLCSENDEEMNDLENSDGCQLIRVPQTDECLQSVLNIVPLQLLSYHLAVLRGHDVDRPRNLAKSVTVE